MNPNNTPTLVPGGTPPAAAYPMRTLGRLNALDEAFATLAAGVDVILEADIGMGSRAITRAAVERAAAHGFIPVEPGDLPRVVTPHHVIIAHATSPSAELLDALRADRSAVSLGVLLVCRPQAPFSAAPAPFIAAVRSAARVITLGPTTRAETNQIAEDLVRAGSIPAMPAAIERQWAWTTGAGFARLTESLLQDLAAAPEAEGALTRSSRRTIVVASEIIRALPAPLLRLACRLLPLIGVRMSRIVRAIDRVELGLLQEQRIIVDADGALCMPAPLQTALRLLCSEDEPDDAVLSVILDICSAVDVGADFCEDELRLVIDELARNAALRALVPTETQRAVHSHAMNLARRRGDTAEAAALARRTLGLGQTPTDAALRTIARADDDDLVAAAAFVRGLDALPGALPTSLWLGCLQLPALSAPDGADELITAVVDRLGPGNHEAPLRALRDSVAAAALLDAGDLSGALSASLAVLQDPGAGVTARVRALTVAAAVHTERLDGAALGDLVAAHIDMLAGTRIVQTLDHDLEFRQALDALLLIALMFASIGVDQPDAFIALVDRSLTGALHRAHAGMVTQLTTCALLQSLVAGSDAEFDGALRMIRRKRSTDLSEWVIALVTTPDAPAPARFGRGRFITAALDATRVLGGAVRGDVIAQPTDPSGFARVDALVAAATRVMTDLRACPEADAESAALDDVVLVAGTIPAALRDVVRGAGRDADLLRAAAATLLERSCVQLAVSVLDLAAPLVAGDRAAERELNRLQRDARSRRHPGATVPSGLTPREREIAGLAASGLSNRDIARTLFLSVRTVESHLYRAMRKSAVTREGLWVIQQDAAAQ